MAEMKNKLGPFFLWTATGMILGLFSASVNAQGYYSAEATPMVESPYAPQTTVSEDMTVGEMLASQNHLQGSAPMAVQPAVGQAVPVTMTRYDGNQAVYSENGSAYGSTQAIPATVPTVRGNGSTAPIHQTAHVVGTSENVNPPQTAPQTLPQTAPQTLPENFPAGEMGPLNSQSLIAFSETVTLPEGPFQQITLIDPVQKVLCVYHINMGTGQIELKSARKVEWDLQLIFLNSKKPLPQDVQAILQQNRRSR